MTGFRVKSTPPERKLRAVVVDGELYFMSDNKSFMCRRKDIFTSFFTTSRYKSLEQAVKLGGTPVYEGDVVEVVI